jgi:hypothetical protein
MTSERRAVWIAAYGAAFAKDFLFAVERMGWDKAVKTAISCEWAIYIADHAVKELERWETDEGARIP